MAEQLICNQQVDGSTPFTSSIESSPRWALTIMGEFPSGQRGQTVNLLSLTSMVRIHLPPPKNDLHLQVVFLSIASQWYIIDARSAAYIISPKGLYRITT